MFPPDYRALVGLFGVRSYFEERTGAVSHVLLYTPDRVVSDEITRKVVTLQVQWQ